MSKKVTRFMHMQCDKVMGSDGMEDRSKVADHLWYFVILRLIYVRLLNHIKFSLIIESPTGLERSNSLLSLA